AAATAATLRVRHGRGIVLVVRAAPVAVEPAAAAATALTAEVGGELALGAEEVVQRIGVDERDVARRPSGRRADQRVVDRDGLGAELLRGGGGVRVRFAGLPGGPETEEAAAAATGAAALVIVAGVLTRIAVEAVGGLDAGGAAEAADLVEAQHAVLDHR